MIPQNGRVKTAGESALNTDEIFIIPKECYTICLRYTKETKQKTTTINVLHTMKLFLVILHDGIYNLMMLSRKENNESNAGYSGHQLFVDNARNLYVDKLTCCCTVVRVQLSGGRFA